MIFFEDFKNHQTKNEFGNEIKANKGLFFQCIHRKTG